jgi:hypothetical protein
MPCILRFSLRDVKPEKAVFPWNVRESLLACQENRFSRKLAPVIAERLAAGKNPVQLFLAVRESPKVEPQWHREHGEPTGPLNLEVRECVPRSNPDWRPKWISGLMKDYCT